MTFANPHAKEIADLKTKIKQGSFPSTNPEPVEGSDEDVPISRAAKRRAAKRKAAAKKE